MNIEGLGIKIVELLIQNNLVKDISDIFYLEVEDLSQLDRMGHKSAKNIISSLSESNFFSFNGLP